MEKRKIEKEQKVARTADKKTTKNLSQVSIAPPNALLSGIF